MMKASVARQLAEALRSGVYRQVQDVLRSDIGYCVLGVACDLFGPRMELFWERVERGSWAPVYRMGFGTAFRPPNEILDFIRDDRVNDICHTSNDQRAWGTLIFDNRSRQGYSCVANLNDEGVSFRQIADMLDRHADQMECRYGVEGVDNRFTSAYFDAAYAGALS